MRRLRMRDVARLIGCPDHFHMSYWESGRVAPDLRYLLRLSAALGCPLEILYSDEFRTVREEVRKRMEKLGIRPEFE